MTDLRLDGRVAWITGASGGPGRALAFGFAGAGAEVVLSGRDENALEQVADQIEARGGRVMVPPGSVDATNHVTATVDAIEAVYGRLDVLVNHADTSPCFSAAVGPDERMVLEALRTNLLGAFACSRLALPLLEAGEQASVLNVCSIHGHGAYERLFTYAVGKDGLEMLTRSLEEEWAGRGIRVNSLAPSYLETEMTTELHHHPVRSRARVDRTPPTHFGGSAEMVACALFLSSPISSSMTGSTLFAAGGWGSD